MSQFVEFSRGDIRYKGGSLPIGSGRIHLGSGNGIVRLLRQGIGGFHKGTKEGAITFNKPTPRAGALDDLEDQFDKQNPVIVTGIPNDATSYEIEGVMQTIDIGMAESSMVSYDTGVVGRYTKVKL